MPVMLISPASRGSFSSRLITSLISERSSSLIRSIRRFATYASTRRHAYASTRSPGCRSLKSTIVMPQS